MKIVQTMKATAAIVALICVLAAPWAEADDWTQRLEPEIVHIDEAMPGRFGVYVKHLGDDRTVNYRADRDWYLASTVKVPLAVALMQLAEGGELSLDQELILADSDFVDGSGDLLWHDPGHRFSVDDLIGRSIRDSDSTATDMLVRLLGEERLNAQIRETMVEGLGPVTTILQVRYDAYGEIHPDVAELSNLDFIDIRAAEDHEGRYRLLIEKLDIDPEMAQVGSASEAFASYYQRGINSGTLETFGLLLERLAGGELLDREHTQRLLEHMEGVTTGDRRIKAGLPANARFAHKTGTQVARSCNVGIVNPHRASDAVIVAACAEDYDRLDDAERAYQALGRALTDAGLVK